MLASTELFIESVIDSLILSDNMGMILPRISGVVSASITCIKDELLKVQKIFQQLQNNKHDKRGIVAHQWVKKVVVHQSVPKKLRVPA
jgi:hypothetical protein